jgi:ribosomal protein S18 acetylase RimI-like enzyme
LALRFNYTIRDCAYGELHQVTSIIMSSFYDAPEHGTSPWRQLYRLGELNRLQQGYPHPGDARRDNHRVLVAVLTADGAADPATAAEESDMSSSKRRWASASQAPPPAVIGYCDVDGRAPNQATGFKYNPRPYLSDLCTDPRYRRSGVARALVRECEEYCRAVLDRPDVYIRVEAKNVPALALYEGMGYRVIPDVDPDRFNVVTTPPQPAQKGEILLLRKDLRATGPGAALDVRPQAAAMDEIYGKTI